MKKNILLAITLATSSVNAGFFDDLESSIKSGLDSVESGINKVAESKEFKGLGDQLNESFQKDFIGGLGGTPDIDPHKGQTLITYANAVKKQATDEFGSEAYYTGKNVKQYTNPGAPNQSIDQVIYNITTVKDQQSGKLVKHKLMINLTYNDEMYLGREYTKFLMVGGGSMPLNGDRYASRDRREIGCLSRIYSSICKYEENVFIEFSDDKLRSLKDGFKFRLVDTGGDKANKQYHQTITIPGIYIQAQIAAASDN